MIYFILFFSPCLAFPPPQPLHPLVSSAIGQTSNPVTEESSAANNESNHIQIIWSVVAAAAAKKRMVWGGYTFVA